ncbi:hypothetical protein ABDK00_006300 [Niabella insulamsoli]|uniref:hypothetical protein n=1 Tax=Niabella insulamsoli TaxID=3144874 RepID=UPI0031FE3065
MKLIYSLLLVLFISFSCSKSDEHTAESQYRSIHSTSSIEETIQGKTRLLNVIENNELLDSELADAINSNDSYNSEQIIHNMANDIANQYQNSGINLYQEFENDETRIILLGMIEDMNDKYLINPSSANIGCFFTAVSTFIGVTQARSIWRSIVSGSYNVGTVIDALKLAGKRVAGVLTVAIMVYDVGECLGWWDATVPITPDPSAVSEPTNINNIPIDFFLGSEAYFDIHWSSIVNYLLGNGASDTTEANSIINNVISCNGDPAYEGTSMIESYFNSIN